MDPVDRVQRSGILTLLLLLLVAVGGLILGPRTPSEEDAPIHGAVVDTDLAANLVPPSRRRRAVGPASFRQELIRDPGGGREGRDINAPLEGAGRAGGGVATEIPFRIADGPRPRPRPAGAGSGRTIRVREGDNPIRIARRELGDGARADELMAYNGISDPRRLRIGQVLQIPPGSVKAASPSRTPEAAGAARVESYTVRRGDTPGEISQRVYGRSKHWRYLLEANGIQDPLKLRVGQVLQVPPLP